MINIIYGGKIIKALESEAVERLKHTCKVKQLTYIEDLEHNSLILLPALEGKTIIIKTLADDEELLYLAQQLKQKLQTSGASIIVEQQQTVKRRVLKLLDDQIVFCLNKSTHQEERILFYTSLFHGNHCNDIVKNLIRHFVKIAIAETNFNIASLLQVLTKVRYWPYLVFTPLPTILIEFGSTKVIKSLGEDLSEWLLNSFISCYGKNYAANDNLTVNQLLEEVDITSQKQEEHEQEKQEHIKQIEEINENIKKLLETIKLKEESLLAKKEEPLEPPQTIKAKDKAKQLTRNEKKIRTGHHKKGSVMSVNKLLFNSNHYPLVLPLDGPVYQFTRTKPHNDLLPVSPANALQTFSNTSVYPPGTVAKSLFHEQFKSNLTEKEAENIEPVEEDMKDGETKVAETKMESSEFASTLQEFKRPDLATEEQNVPLASK
ncbi:MAG: hypothetical protein ACOX1Y_06280 [Zhaonellaceae bacterium]|nr:hypothetical protein [Clostridia bacterium]